MSTKPDMVTAEKAYQEIADHVWELGDKKYGLMDKWVEEYGKPLGITVQWCCGMPTATDKNGNVLDW
ncbi:MAG TPA: hypothetical protein VGR89_00440 [Puia sp.]|nr:hypothetical protein [Puia sp.]